MPDNLPEFFRLIHHAGWLELFLNAAEKRTFSRWQEEINDKSLTHRATKNAFDRIAALIPENVAPNIITATGL